MKILLTQNVPGVGEAGAIKEVADGYARNYLIPQKMATPATRNTVKQAEAQAESLARKANKQRDETQRTASALDGKTVRIYARTGSENRLYGSVTAADVADAASKQFGVTVDRRKVELTEAIHRTGTYSATADFGSGIVATFQVEVAPEASGAFGGASGSEAGTDTGTDIGMDIGTDAKTSGAGGVSAGSPEGGAGTGDAAPEAVAEQEAEANPT